MRTIILVAFEKSNSYFKKKFVYITVLYFIIVIHNHYYFTKYIFINYSSTVNRGFQSINENGLDISALNYI